MSNISTILMQLFTNLGQTGDAASITGTANAKLAFLRQQAATVSTIVADTGTNGVVVDSGVLAANEYQVLAFVAQSSDGGSYSSSVDIQYRNAANDANNWTQLINGWMAASGNYTQGGIWIPRITVAANERFRLVTAAAINTSNSFALWIGPV